MASWTHPTLGLIVPLPSKLQPKKVWKHFYAQEEHWERLCDQDPRRLRQEVEAVVGVRRDQQHELPHLDSSRWPGVRGLLQRHHDDAYGVTYLAEMGSAETIWSLGMDSRFRHAALTPRSIYLIVQLDQPSWVVNAFRPHPPGEGVLWEEEDFRRQGLWKLSKENGMSNREMTRWTAEQLRRTASSVPADERELWWLASAVGFGRMLSREPEIASVLPAAEATLTSVDTRVKAALSRTLDWEGTAGRIAAGLRDDRPEELEEALSETEDMMAAAAVLGVEKAAEGLLTRAAELLPWMPAQWDHLLARAANRRETLGGMIGRLWETVEESLTGALLRQGPAAALPAHRLVEEIMLEAEGLPSFPSRTRILDRAAGIMSALEDSLLNTLAPAQAWLRSLQPMCPSPAMGAGTADTDQPWELRCPAPLGPLPQRVFVVDAENPVGHEVTEYAEAGGVSLWSLEAVGQEALVVLFVSESPVQGESLEEALAFAEQRDSVAVVTRIVSRPR